MSKNMGDCVISRNSPAAASTDFINAAVAAYTPGYRACQLLYERFIKTPILEKFRYFNRMQ